MLKITCPLQAADGTPIDPAKAATSIATLLDKETLCSVASVSDKGQAHINTAFFAFDGELRLFLLFEPASRHARYLKSNPSAALTVFPSTQRWGESLCGLQLFGEIKPVDAGLLLHGYSTYAKRFLKFSDWIKKPGELLEGACATRLMVFTPEHLTLFDEATFGKDEFINLEVKRS